MDIVKLKSRPRNGTGKSVTRKIRVQGWIPAVYYGRSFKAQNIEVDQREFAALVRGRKITHLIDLGLGSQENSIAVIKEVQRDVLKDERFIHIDFQHVNMNEKVIVDVPVEITGVSIGVKESNGVLGHPVKSIKVECMPLEIPEKIVVDVSALDIGDSIHVRDLVVPEGATIKDSPEEVVAVVTHASREVVEEVKPEDAAAAAAEGAAPAEGAKSAAGAKAPGEAKGKEKKE